MPEILNLKRGATVLLYLSLMFCACHQVQEIPFPEELTEYPQPQTFPLELTDPKPLRWDTIGKGAIIPTVFPLDFQKLQGIPYDAEGFKPLPFAPTQSSFQFSALPSRSFDLERSPAHSLEMKMKNLPLPSSSVKLQKPERVASATIDLKIWQQVVQLNVVIYGMSRDSSGLVWFATSNGIYRFDGTKLTNMILGASAYSLCFDKEGNLWYIETSDVNRPGIVKVNFKNKTTGKGFFNFSISSISKIIMGNDGHIWISGSTTSPPVMVSPEKMVYHTFDSKAGFTSSRYYTLAIDPENRTWICSRNGIEIVDRKVNKVLHIGRENGLSSDTVTAIVTGADGRIWAAGLNGVDAIDARSGKISHYPISKDNNQRAYCLMFDKAGQLWIGRTDGLYIINFSDNTLRYISSAGGLVYDNVVELLEHKTGQLLATGFTNTFSRSTVYTIGQSGKTVYPFQNTTILCATEDSKNNIWVGTENELFVVDSARKTYWRLDVANGLANKFIESVTEQNGKIVITTNGGYNIFDPSKNEWLRVTRKEGLLMDTVYSWTADHKDNLWITGTSNGIFKYDRSAGYIFNLASRGGLNGDFIAQASALPQSNNMMMVTVNSGPNIIDPENNTVRFIKNIPGMDTFSYKGITLDSHGRIWITGTSGYGVYMIDLAGRKVTRFTTAEGLSDNSTNSILEYKGRMLVCTNQKVNIITPPELSSRHRWEVSVLRHSEGFKKITTSFVSDAITKRGNYLWGDVGLGIIYGIEADTSFSTDYVTGIRIMGKDVAFAQRKEMQASDTTHQKSYASLSSAGYTEKGDLRWDSLAGPYGLPVHLSLPYNQNIVQFSFSEMSTGRPDSAEFAYVLEGIDKKWTPTKDLQTETYLNLAPGDYTFKVSSRWQNDRWNEPATFSFTIRPPWYNTWWAYLVYLITAASLLRLYIVFRSRKLMRENKLLEEKVNRRTEELQQSYNNVEKLEEIGKKITSTLSVEKIIGTVYNNVNALMDASVFGIGIYNEALGRLDFPATYENGHLLPFYSNAINEKNRLSTICFNEGREIVMGNVGEEHKDYIQQIPTPIAGEQAVSLIYLPLVAKEEKLGVITVQSFQPNAYSDYHLFMLRNIAIYTAIALENARSYEDLKSTQAQLVQSEKMASLGELTAGIAHEIQNPLNFVNNFSEVNMDLIREMDEEIGKGNYDEVRELAANIRGNEEKIIFHGKRADGIVKSMLQHSRNSSTSKELTDINSLCDEYLRLAFHGMRAKDKSFNSGMETSFDENAGKINIVPQDIGRVLLNLLTNAFYEVNEKRKEASPEYTPMVKVKTTRTGGNVEIEVSDNGKGIPEDVRKKIFQPFFTTKPTGKGTGLGLSLSYDIIKAHGGKIKVETKENEGSKFIIQLPIAGS